MSGPRNVALILSGPDRGPEWDLLLLQDDGSEHQLMHVRSADALGVGFLFEHAARAMGLRLDMRHVPAGSTGGRGG